MPVGTTSWVHGKKKWMGCGRCEGNDEIVYSESNEMNECRWSSEAITEHDEKKRRY